ncbi:MAG: hypothetical protein JJU36_14360 [Phycisphaeraceae bacterium]|nr:hypothetical protein [Phycisphaeraceae bacterium]
MKTLSDAAGRTCTIALNPGARMAVNTRLGADRPRLQADDPTSGGPPPPRLGTDGMVWKPSDAGFDAIEIAKIGRM